MAKREENKVKVRWNDLQVSAPNLHVDVLGSNQAEDEIHKDHFYVYSLKITKITFMYAL